MTKRDDTFILFYLDEFTEFLTDNPQAVYCISESTRQLCLSALRFAGWPTRWRKNQYDTEKRVTGGDVAIIKGFHNLAAEELINDMGNCLDGLTDLADAVRESSNASAISELADAVKLLAKSQCCENSSLIADTNGGVNGSTEGGELTYGTVPYADFPETYPDGYTDQEHFDAQLCAKANQLIDGVLYFIDIIGGTATFNAVGGTVIIALGLVGVLAVPEVAVPALIAAVAVAWLASGTLLELKVAINANRQEILCILVSGDNFNLVINALSDLFDDIIGSIPLSGAPAVAVKTILMILFSSDTLNWLVETFAGFNYPDADCSDCTGPDLVYIHEFGGSTATLEDGNLAELGEFQSMIGTVFEDQTRQMVMLYSLPDGTTTLDYTFNLISGSDTEYFISYTDETGTPANTGWSATLPASLTAQIVHIVGSDNGNTTPFVVEIGYSVPE